MRRGDAWGRRTGGVIDLGVAFPNQEMDLVLESLPIARGISRPIRPRRFNGANNAGFILHVSYDADRRRGHFLVESLVTSDADIADSRVDVAWVDLVREATDIARAAQYQADKLSD